MTDHFEKFKTDVVHLKKPDGSKLGPFKTYLRDGRCEIDDVSIEITPGDGLEREIPGGRLEKFTVQSVDYVSGFHSIPAHFKITLSRKG